MTIAKPQLRGHHMSHMKKHMGIATVIGIVAYFSFKTLVCDRRKKVYAEFYRLNPFLFCNYKKCFVNKYLSYQIFRNCYYKFLFILTTYS